MLVGQKKLKKRFIDLLNAYNLPNTMVFVGPTGQGKRTMATWLAEMMEASIYVPEDLKIDSIRTMIEDSRTLSGPKLYLLADAEEMTMQAQNSLLKLAEEPPENAYIVITVQDTEVLLPTIMSRSVKFSLDGYSTEELEEFTDDEELMKIATNPGTIRRLNMINYRESLKHARKVAENIADVSAANSFNILRYTDKENYDLFLTMLIHSYGEKIARGEQCSKQLAVIYETKTMIDRHKSINKLNALEMMLIKLRGAARNEVQ